MVGWFDGWGRVRETKVYWKYVGLSEIFFLFGFDLYTLGKMKFNPYPILMYSFPFFFSLILSFFSEIQSKQVEFEGVWQLFI